MLVHFPIALGLIGFLAELISSIYKKEICFTKLSFYLLITATLAALVTWLSGVLFTGEMSGAAGDVKETHEMLAVISLVLLTVTSLLRIFIMVKKSDSVFLKWFSFLTYAAAAVCVGLTGFYGGTLVYNYMMPL
jgi:uncharacterized membrane protein